MLDKTTSNWYQLPKMINKIFDQICDFLAANKQILGSIFVVGAMTFAVKTIALGKELAIAASFGVTGTLDAFFIANMLPDFAINVISGSLNAAFIPTYIKVRENEGKTAAQELFAKV